MEKKFNKGSKSGSKSKSRDYKSKCDKDVEREPKHASIPEKNDWRFYAASDEIARDIASLPFNYLGGTPFKAKAVKTVMKSDGSTDSVSCVGKPLQSVMAIDVLNSVGTTSKATEGINMAATQLYTYVRHQNSGARNYESADIMMYILAMRDVYSQFFFCKKVLGMAGLYNYYNHNLPDLLIKASGVNPVDLRSNLAQYRGWLNLLAKKINSFAVPKYFKVFDRSAFINSYIFMDSDSVRGQMYIFNKPFYYTWSGTTSETGTELIANNQFVQSDNPTDLSFFMNNLETMIDALYLDEDALTMSGDILKAFGEGGLYQIAQTQPDYQTPMVFDEDVLAQIENSNSVFNGNAQTDYLTRFDPTKSNINVQQSNQLITFVPTFVGPQVVTAGVSSYTNLTDRPLNSHKKDPNYTDVLEWTRLMSTVNYEYAQSEDKSTAAIKATINTSGLEIVMQYRMFSYTNRGGIEVNQLSNFSSDPTELMQYDWHPIIYRTDIMGDLYIGGDLKVATLISNDTLDSINQAAVYGAFYGASLYDKK